MPPGAAEGLLVYLLVVPFASGGELNLTYFSLAFLTDSHKRVTGPSFTKETNMAA